MKHFLLVATFILFSFGLINGIDINSTITEVTVFSDRAMVMRTGEVKVSVGENVVVFEKIPQSLDPQSIQISGQGNFSLRDVRVIQKFHTGNVSEKIALLKEKLKNLTEDNLVVLDQIKEAEAEKLYLDNILKRVTSDNNNSENNELEPEKWMGIASFYRKAINRVHLEIRTAKNGLEVIRQEMNAIQKELQVLGEQSGKISNSVEVAIESNVSGMITLSLRYAVLGPSWRPDYSIKVDSSKSQVELNYQAIIRQGTGEDWRDSVIQLSTAKPQISGSMPSVPSWTLDVYIPPVPRKETYKRSMMNKSYTMVEESDSETDSLAMGEMAVKTASVESGATSAIFVLPNRNTVLSDNKETKLTITILNFEAKMIYSAAPKVTPFAYLRAQIELDKDFPILPGASHIFLDSAYVGESKLDLTVPGETFFADLGVDESIKIERRLVERKDQTTGLVSKKKIRQYTYQTEIKNNKKSDINISLYDKLPVSVNSQIIVNVKDPDPKNVDQKLIERNDDGTIIRHLQIQKGKSVKANMIFSIEYPEDVIITGLE